MRVLVERTAYRAKAMAYSGMPSVQAFGRVRCAISRKQQVCHCRSRAVSDCENLFYRGREGTPGVTPREMSRLFPYATGPARHTRGSPRVGCIRQPRMHAGGTVNVSPASAVLS